MEVTDNTENVAPPAEDVSVKHTDEEPKETVTEAEEPMAEEIVTNEDKKEKPEESKSEPIVAPPSSSGDTEVRQPRVRKQVQRLSDMLSTSFTKEKEAKEKALDEMLAKGSGTPLGDIPLIEASIKKSKPVDLKVLHYACFGRAGTVNEVRSNLRKFNGLPFDAKSDEFAKREAALNKEAVEIFPIGPINIPNSIIKLMLTHGSSSLSLQLISHANFPVFFDAFRNSFEKPVREVQEALRQLHLEVSGPRAQIVTRLLEFLLKPEASVVKYKGKLPPSKRSRKSRTDSSSDSKKNSQSGRKSKKSSKESDEEEGSGDEELEKEGSETEEKPETTSATSAKEASDSDDDDDFFPAGGKKQKKAAGKKKSAPKKRKAASTSKSATPAKRRKRAKKAETESESEQEEDEPIHSEESGDENSKEEKTDDKTEDKQDSDNNDDDRPLVKVSSSPIKSDEAKSDGGENQAAAAESSKPAEGENESVPLPSDEELKEKTVELLKKSNLNEVSMKTIRQSIADLYSGVDLSSKKDYINGLIKEAFSDPHSVIAYRGINEIQREKPCWKATLVSPWFYISTIGFLIALGMGLHIYSQSKLKPVDIDLLEVAKCPACFGQSACPAFFRGDVRLPTFYGYRPIHASDFEKFDGLTDVDLGMLERKPAVLRQLYFPSTSSAVDVEVCRRQRSDDFQDEAPLPRCIPRLSIWRWMATDGPGTSDPVDVNIVRNMSVFTRCASPRLLQLIQSRYRERPSNLHLPAQKLWLRFDELTLLFNLAINPHTVTATTFPSNEGWPFPLQLGACGRMTLEKGTTKPLSLFVNAPVKTRLQILKSLLQIPSKLVSNATLVDPKNGDFALYLGDYRWNVFGVDPFTYHVSIIQARHIIAVDLREIEVDFASIDPPFLSHFSNVPINSSNPKPPVRVLAVIIASKVSMGNKNNKVKSPFVIETNATYIQDACQEHAFATGPPCLSEEHVSGLCGSNPPSDHNYWAVCMTATFGDRLLVRDMSRDLLFSLEQCLKDSQDGARRSHIEAALEVISMELTY
ncbi:hypothetical protein ACTXT7_002776 [Hymenolepis weldensis]